VRAYKVQTFNKQGCAGRFFAALTYARPTWLERTPPERISATRILIICGSEGSPLFLPGLGARAPFRTGRPTRWSPTKRSMPTNGYPTTRCSW